MPGPFGIQRENEDMTQPDGIDMRNSGWTNPEGFQRAPRPSTPVQTPAACEAPGPDGWVCDLRPGHPGDRHWADDGSAEGLKWRTEMHETTTLSERARGEQSFIPGRILDDDRTPDTPVAKIGELAERALASERPSAWAVALNAILEVCRGIDQ